MRRKFLVSALAALGVSGAIAASVPEYEAAVQQHYADERPLKTLSLAPVVCPADLDCDDFEKELVEQLADRTGLKIIEPKTVRELMARAGVTNLDYEGRMIIGEALGVDAFAIVNVQKLQTDVISSPEHDKWKNLRKEGTIKRAELELRVLARDGAPLVQVSGTANVFDTLRGLPSITKKLFAMMLERAWS